MTRAWDFRNVGQRVFSAWIGRLDAHVVVDVLVIGLTAASMTLLGSLLVV